MITASSGIPPISIIPSLSGLSPETMLFWSILSVGKGLTRLRAISQSSLPLTILSFSNIGASEIGLTVTLTVAESVSLPSSRTLIYLKWSIPL